MSDEDEGNLWGIGITGHQHVIVEAETREAAEQAALDATDGGDLNVHVDPADVSKEDRDGLSRWDLNSIIRADP